MKRSSDVDKENQSNVKTETFTVSDHLREFVIFLRNRALSEMSSSSYNVNSFSGNTQMFIDESGKNPILDVNNILSAGYVYTEEGRAARVDLENEYELGDEIKVNNMTYNRNSINEFISFYLSIFDNSLGKNPGLDVVITKTQKMTDKLNEKKPIFVFTMTFLELNRHISTKTRDNLQVIIIAEERIWRDNNKKIIPMNYHCMTIKSRMYQTYSKVRVNLFGSEFLDVDLDILTGKFLEEKVKHHLKDFVVHNPTYKISKWYEGHPRFDELDTISGKLFQIGGSFPKSTSGDKDKIRSKKKNEPTTTHDDMEVDVEYPQKRDINKALSPSLYKREDNPASPSFRESITQNVSTTEEFNPKSIQGDNFFLNNINIIPKMGIPSLVYAEYAKMIKPNVEKMMQSLVDIPGGSKTVFLISSIIRILQNRATILDCIVLISSFIPKQRYRLPEDIIIEFVKYASEMSEEDEPSYDTYFREMEDVFYEKFKKIDEDELRRRINIIKATKNSGVFKMFLLDMFLTRYGYDVFYYELTKKHNYEYDSLQNLMYYLIEFHRFTVSKNGQDDVDTGSLFCSIISLIFSSTYQTVKPSIYNKISAEEFDNNKKTLESKSLQDAILLLVSPQFLFCTDDTEKNISLSKEIIQRIRMNPDKKTNDSLKILTFRPSLKNVKSIDVILSWIRSSEYRKPDINNKNKNTVELDYQKKNKQASQKKKAKKGIILIGSDTDDDIKIATSSKNISENDSSDTSSHSRSSFREIQSRSSDIIQSRSSSTHTTFNQSIKFEDFLPRDFVVNSRYFFDEMEKCLDIFPGKRDEYRPRSFGIDNNSLIIPYVLKNFGNLPLFREIYLLWISFTDSFDLAPFLIQYFSKFIRNDKKVDILKKYGGGIDVFKQILNASGNLNNPEMTLMNVSRRIKDFMDSPIFKNYIKPYLFTPRGFMFLLGVFRENMAKKSEILNNIMEILGYCFENHMNLNPGYNDTKTIHKFFESMTDNEINADIVKIVETKITERLLEEEKLFYDKANILNRQVYVLDFIRYLVSPNIFKSNQCINQILNLHIYLEPFIPESSSHGVSFLTIEVDKFKVIHDILMECSNIRIVDTDYITQPQAYNTENINVEKPELSEHSKIVLVQEYKNFLDNKIKEILDEDYINGSDEKTLDRLLKFIHADSDHKHNWDDIEFIQIFLLENNINVNIIEDNSKYYIKKIQSEYGLDDNGTQEESSGLNTDSYSESRYVFEKSDKEKDFPDYSPQPSFKHEYSNADENEFITVYPKKNDKQISAVANEGYTHFADVLSKYVETYSGGITIKKMYNVKTSEMFKQVRDKLNPIFKDVMVYQYLDDTMFAWIKNEMKEKGLLDELQMLENMRSEVGQ